MNNLFLLSNTFSIFGLNFSLYGVMIAIAMISGVMVAVFICKRKNIDSGLPIDLALFALPCSIIGARLYFCIFNGVNSFYEIFEIWNGGMAIYGGIIGGFLGLCLCCKIKKISLLLVCDIAAPCLILGQAIGRIGCYFAGCCYGIETTVEWMKIFPISVEINGVWHLSTFFYECFLNLVGFIILMFFENKSKKEGIVTALYLIVYGLIRGFLETFRDDSACLFVGGIRVSQLLSFILVIVGIILFVFCIKSKKNIKNTKIEEKNEI